MPPAVSFDAGKSHTVADKRQLRLQRRESRQKEEERKGDPWLDSIGVGAGRKELHRLILHYSHGKKQNLDDAKNIRSRSISTPAALQQERAIKRAVKLESRIPGGARRNDGSTETIEDVFQKKPWERRGDEIEAVRGLLCRARPITGCTLMF